MYPTTERLNEERLKAKLSKLSKESEKQSEKIKELEARIEKMEENK